MSVSKMMILHATSGSGHTRAAEAVAKVAARHPRVGEVINIDALDYTNAIFREFYSGMYEQMVTRTPDLWGMWYETSNEPWKSDKMRLMLDKLNLQDLVKRITDEKPDIAVCTHFLPAEIISHIISKGLVDTRLAIVVTDFYVHAMWLSRIFHRYFVAHEESRAHLEMLGFPGERVTVSGIPIDPVFTETHDPAALRAAYGIRPDLPLILVSAGAFGLDSAEDVVRMMKRLQTKVTVAVVCGQNTELRERLQTFVDKSACDYPIYRIEGYTEAMHEWMAMADLFIGKPGGLTTAEAMTSGLPMAIYQPIPGQEEHNSDHLLEFGAAIKCSEILTLPYKVDKLLQDEPRMAAMKMSALELAFPHAAETVVDTLVDNMKLSPHNLTVHTG
ncbi:MAG: glycosyltransferase [Spartobacteria bacterium]|nr:glycosyltransferase [Spartobacteria bacterium]